MPLPGVPALARAAGKMFPNKGFRLLIRTILQSVMSMTFSPEAIPTGRLDRELALLLSRPEILVSMVHVTRGYPCAQLFDGAPDIRCPTLFLHGQEDAIVPARYARAIHERIVGAGGNSQFHLVRGAGHMLIDYQASELADVILRWLVAENLVVSAPELGS